MHESFAHSVWRRFKRHKAGVVSLIILGIIVLTAILAPVLARHDPNAINPAFSSAPTGEYWLGTDQMGRDVFSRLLYGTRVSLTVGVLSTLLATSIGTVLGLLAGYFGGAVDMIIMRITDMIMSFPYIMLILVAGVIFKPGMWMIIIILGLIDWPGVARLVRGEVLSLREKDFVHSSEIAGMPKSIVKRANTILKQLETDNTGVGSVGKPSAEQLNQNREGMQLSFFQLDDPVLCQIRDEILGLDVNNLTPVEALNKLNEIKKIIGGNG